MEKRENYHIEKFGTGVLRINEEYSDSIVKPSYKITENFITVTLPTVEIKPGSLSSDEKVGDGPSTAYRIKGK